MMLKIHCVKTIFIITSKTKMFTNLFHKDVKEMFDTSNYEAKRHRPNKKVIDLMKDELCGRNN